MFDAGLGAIPQRSVQLDMFRFDPQNYLHGYNPRTEHSEYGLLCGGTQEAAGNDPQISSVYVLPELPDQDDDSFRLRTKGFYWRSVHNICDKDDGDGHTPIDGVAQTQLNPLANHASWTGGAVCLYMPFKVEDEQTHYGITSETVTCVEPFFGYCTGTNALRCDHPLDTARNGKLFPPVIQDYTYTMSRDYSKLFQKGYQHDLGCTLRVTPEPAEFTLVREMADFKQADKQLSKIGETTHTIQKHEVTYAPGDKPIIQIETRQGNFEYVFLWTQLKRTSETIALPTTNPVIEGLRLHVQGRENRFVRALDRFDLERMSRSNCHELCNWRERHEKGEGILLHLADLGLTEEIPFPFRARFQIEFQLTASKDPETEQFGNHETMSSYYALSGADANQRTFHAALIRHNQLLRGDSADLRFVYLNEER
jgi:hypothetical protein